MGITVHGYCIGVQNIDKSFRFEIHLHTHPKFLKKKYCKHSIGKVYPDKHLYFDQKICTCTFELISNVMHP